MIRILDQVAWIGNGQMLVQSFAGAVRLVRETGKPIAQIARIWASTPAPGVGADQQRENTMTARPEVVALLTDFDVERTGSRQRFMHRDGRLFTAEETDLIATATDEDMRAAASQLAAAPERLAELAAPYLRAVAEDMADPRPPTEAP